MNREDYQIQYEKMREDICCQLNKAKEELYYKKNNKGILPKDNNLSLGIISLKYILILALLIYTYIKLF